LLSEGGDARGGDVLQDWQMADRADNPVLCIDPIGEERLERLAGMEHR